MLPFPPLIAPFRLNGRSMLRDDQELDTDALGNVKLKPMIVSTAHTITVCVLRDAVPV